MLADAIRIDHLTKRYGSAVAVDDLSLAIPRGSVYGLVGRNGAGKTTTIRILLGLAHQTSGTFTVLDGASADRVGYLPDVPAFYPWMTGPEYLAHIADICEMPRDQARGRIASVLALADLAEVPHRIEGYSRGMKQRLGIAQALIAAPDVLILDEPTSALDPLGRRDMLEMLTRLRGKTTVLFSTHILDDVERVADRIGILHKGKLLAEGTMPALKTRAALPDQLVLEIVGDADAMARALQRETWVSDIARDGRAILLPAADITVASHRIPAIAVDLGIGIERFEHRRQTLEDIFVAITEAAS